MARSILASATALTLFFSETAYLFHPVVGMSSGGPLDSDPLFKLGFFYLFGEERLELARWVAIAALSVVASGWRPRFTGWLHSWISWSLVVNATLVDGGDQIASNITLLLLPVTLTDPRTWHWGHPPANGCAEAWKRLAAHWGLFLIRIQVAAVYLQSSIAKFGVEEWADGTACYYWLKHPTFGSWMSGVVDPIVGNAVLITGITWGTMMLEYALSFALVLARRVRVTLLTCGLCLHLGILVFHGLVSFSCIMFGALILYLWPIEWPLLPRERTGRAPRCARGERQGGATSIEALS